MSIRSIGERAPAIPSTPTPAAHPHAAAHRKPAHAPAEPFARLVAGLGHELNAGEHTVQHAIAAGGAGRDLDPGELIALQAGVYRYGEAVDLASKLVDHAATGIKSVVQGQ